MASGGGKLGPVSRGPWSAASALNFLQDAVRCETVSGRSREPTLARMLAGVLEREGIPCDLRVCGGGANLTATLRGGYPGPRLVLSGHLDTVPIGDRGWSHPPFGAEVVGDRLYGRGSADMKGGLVALLAAFIDAKDRLATMAGELVLAATYGEEIGSKGAIRMLEDGQLGSFDGMIVAEPTSNRLVRAHKGALWVKVTASGRTAHSSAPREGVNAIDLIQTFRNELEKLDLSSDPDDLLTPSTMAVTQIAGGKGRNIIPDACSMTIDFRTLPGQDHAILLEELRTRASRIADATPGSSLTISALTDLPSVRTEPGAPLVEAVKAALERAGRGRGPPGAANYFTDASVFQRVGGDIVVLGPGRAEQAHQTDEYIEISEFHDAIGIYAAAIEAFHRPGSTETQKPTEKVD